MLYVIYATNQRNWSLELYRRIGAMVPSMTGKDMNCSYVRNVSFMPATLRKERADEFMFDENFDPSTLDGFGLK
jgi:hypothetical protein